jgi:hypothetical protein
MTAELTDNDEFPTLQVQEATDHRTVFPEPAAKHVVDEITEATRKNKRTFPVNPQ